MLILRGGPGERLFDIIPTEVGLVELSDVDSNSGTTVGESNVPIDGDCEEEDEEEEEEDEDNDDNDVPSPLFPFSLLLPLPMIVVSGSDEVTMFCTKNTKQTNKQTNE